MMFIALGGDGLTRASFAFSFLLSNFNFASFETASGWLHRPVGAFALQLTGFALSELFRTRHRQQRVPTCVPSSPRCFLHVEGAQEIGQSRRDIRALMSSTDITCAVDAARITNVASWTSAAGIGPNPRSG